jgi:hypothetical protein
VAGFAAQMWIADCDCAPITRGFDSTAPRVCRGNVSCQYRLHVSFFVFAVSLIAGR